MPFNGIRKGLTPGTNVARGEKDKSAILKEMSSPARSLSHETLYEKKFASNINLVSNSITNFSVNKDGAMDNSEVMTDKRIFIIRDFHNPRGRIPCEYSDGKLPRSTVESYIPWAITADSDVVYAKYGEHRGFNKSGSQKFLKRYATEVSQERRRLCQSALGALVLGNMKYTAEAVESISQGVRNYLSENYEKDPDKTLSIVVKNIGHYFFSGGRQNFGRISEENASIHTSKYIWDKIILALETGTLEQKMAIHDAVGRKVLPVLKGAPLAAYVTSGKEVRQEWFDEKEVRGRVNRTSKALATMTAGIAKESDASLTGTVTQARIRGVDIFERDENRKGHPEADDFYGDLDTRNLLFGGGISGTSGTLLQAAEAFGPLDNIEHKKQYMLAIIGYLVGGGMHSYHECMIIAKRIGIPYSYGSYIESLPESFKSSDDFQQWNHNYYDISTLGGIHWIFNKVK